jgi:16S rRNA (cytidine1402-2'-O)-methyltransferase
MTGQLYLVATPIGNLNDLSPRAAKTLEAVDFIAAEDTRVTIKLLNHLGLKKPMVSYYRHNFEASGQAILSRLLAGESCALVSDAGTPAISDPGEELVSLCQAHGIEITAIPGPCAFVSALILSGLPTGRFTFEGFLAMNKKNRREHLAALQNETRTMIFYEAPHKLRSTLSDFLDVFGPERNIALCRELTKLHEEIIRTTLSEAVQRYEALTPKGEFVLVIEGTKAAEPPQDCSLPQALERVSLYRDEGLSLKAAAKKAAEETGFSKNQLYAAALHLSDPE